MCALSASECAVDTDNLLSSLDPGLPQNTSKNIESLSCILFTDDPTWPFGLTRYYIGMFPILNANALNTLPTLRCLRPRLLKPWHFTVICLPSRIWGEYCRTQPNPHHSQSTSCTPFPLFLPIYNTCFSLLSRDSPTSICMPSCLPYLMLLLYLYQRFL